MNSFGLHRRWRASLWALSLAGALLSAGRAEEPRWLKLRPPEASLGMEVESASEETRVAGNSSTYEHLSLTPLLGLRTRGSIYHPNLLTFDLNAETGWGWDRVSTQSPGSSQTRTDSQDLQRYLVTLNFLAAKPYNATFFASQDHGYRDYGTFSTFTVDSLRYGGRMSWFTESWNLSADAGYRDEKSSGLNDATELAETYFNFTGIKRRHLGQTTLTYRFNEFDNTLNGGFSQSSVNNAFGLSDSETFGSRQQITATTGVGYSQSQYGGQQTETVTANENVTIRHRPKLDSYFSLDYSHSRQGSVTAGRLQGAYGVRHQLYESLTSNADAHGSYEDNSSFSGAASNDRYGLSLFESYTKRLGTWGRLTLGGGVIADHEDYNSTGGVLTTIDEPHQVYLPTSVNYRPVYLNHPRVLTLSIQVSVAGDFLSETNDFQIVGSGDLTEIRLVFPPSAHLQSLLQSNDNVTVMVTYQSDSLNNASFESVNASTQFRLDLFNHFGLYARMNWLENNAPAQVFTQSLTDTVAGTDFTWRYLRTGAEYEDYDSNFSQYQSWRFYQNFNFRPADGSSLNVDFIQTFYRYADNRSQTQYQFLSRYSTQLLFSLAWYVEGGYAIQDVLGTEQLLGSARTGLSWSRGKLSLRTGYEFNQQTTATGQWTEERVKHRFYAYLKRTF